MRRHKKKYQRIAAIAASSLLLAGCVPGSPDAHNSKIPPGTLAVGIAATDLPNMDTGLTLNIGAGGLAFVGLSIYEGLTKWDLSQGETLPEVSPALATAWEANEDATEWTFDLRPGVEFTDGTEWDAEAAAFNINRYVNDESPQFYPELHGMTGMFNGGIESAEVLDELTVKINTSRPVSALPYNLAGMPMGSPTAIKELGNEDFGKSPVGTGPFTYHSSERGQSMTLKRNDDYWGEAPNIDTLVLKPIPDPTARTAALLAGDINWLESPNPNDLTMLIEDGYTVNTNTYDHHWIWQLDLSEKPLSDVRVRQAMNFAINRESMTESILQGIAVPMSQSASPGNIGYKPENDMFKYDPEQAKALLAEAGYGDGFSMKLSYPTGGGSNLLPKEMNVALQRDLAAVGIDVTLEPVSWESMSSTMNEGRIPGDADAINFAGSLDPEPFWVRYLGSEGARNLANYSNPEVDQLFEKAAATVDPGERAAIYTEVSRLVTADSPWLFVASSLNPRVTAPNVTGFVQPKSWFVDITRLKVQ